MGIAEGRTVDALKFHIEALDMKKEFLARYACNGCFLLL